MSDMRKLLQNGRDEYHQALNYNEVMQGVNHCLSTWLTTTPQTQNLSEVATQLRAEFEQRVGDYCHDPMLNDLLLFFSPYIRWNAMAKDLVHARHS